MASASRSSSTAGARAATASGGLAALVADLGGRLGSDALQLGLRISCAGGAERGRAAAAPSNELLAALEKRSGQSLAQFRADFLEPRRLARAGPRRGPQPGPGGRRIRGERPLAQPRPGRGGLSGGRCAPTAASCGRSAGRRPRRHPFTFATAQRPILVELDPGATCLRFVPGGARRPRRCSCRRLCAASLAFPAAGGADLELLLEGKLLFFLVADFLMVAWGLVLALVSSGKLPKIYQMAVILPMLILLVSSLSAVIALERRAGSLDLALAAPDPTAFFLRRAIAPLALVLVQGWVVLLLAYAERHPLADLLAGRLAGWEVMARAFFGSIVVALLIAAITLFWATRLRAGGAVASATRRHPALSCLS